MSQPIDPARRTELVARYRTGHAAVLGALEGIADADLDARPPGDGEWTPREIVNHLADAEMEAAIRLRRLLAEEAPVIVAFDESDWAARLHYDARPIGPALDALAAALATTADLLDRMSDDDWTRAGTHSVRGHYDVGQWLELYAAHAHDHAAQIRRARAATGRAATAG